MNLVGSQVRDDSNQTSNGPDSRTPEHVRSRQERFLELLRPHNASLSRFARAMTRDADAAKDLISETVLKAFESFDSLRDGSSFLSYLFTIAVRLHNRERSRGKLWGIFDREHAEQLPYKGSAPDASVDVQLLYAALKHLPEKQREAIVLFEISGLSLEEIREIQGGSLSGVKSRIVRGRASLAELLGVAADRAQASQKGDQETTAISKLDRTAANPLSGSRRSNRSLLATGAEMNITVPADRQR